MSIATAYCKIGESVNANIVKQMEAQGHTMTGSFEQSLEVLTDDKGVSGVGNTYGIYVNIGVKPEEIKYPYAKKRIDGLKAFVKYRMGLGDDEAEPIAYAIATKHAQDGMPTERSKRFSQAKGSKRTDFIDDAIEQADEEIQQIIFDEFITIINKAVNITGR